MSVESTSSNILWPGVEKYFTFLKEEGDNIILKCHSCPLKSLSTSKSSLSNLKRHIKVCKILNSKMYLINKVRIFMQMHFFLYIIAILHI